MAEKHAAEIEESIRKTVAYGFPDRVPAVGASGVGSPEVKLLKTDSVTAAVSNVLGKTTVLNFASYKHPGGMFLSGSSAQEECLCHESFLYNVLEAFDGTYYAYNRKHANRSLYTNRALFTPGIVFEKKGCPPQPLDVLTVAAPNYYAAEKYEGVTREENNDILAGRIAFIKGVLEDRHVTTLIAGAFGCGVFGQDPHVTAGLFFKVFEYTSLSRIVYAIPGGENYGAFRKEYEKKHGF